MGSIRLSPGHPKIPGHPQILRIPEEPADAYPGSPFAVRQFLLYNICGLGDLGGMPAPHMRRRRAARRRAGGLRGRRADVLAVVVVEGGHPRVDFFGEEKRLPRADVPVVVANDT